MLGTHKNKTITINNSSIESVWRKLSVMKQTLTKSPPIMTYRLRNYRYCVGWGVRLYSLIPSNDIRSGNNMVVHTRSNSTNSRYYTGPEDQWRFQGEGGRASRGGTSAPSPLLPLNFFQKSLVSHIKHVQFITAETLSSVRPPSKFLGPQLLRSEDET